MKFKRLNYQHSYKKLIITFTHRENIEGRKKQGMHFPWSSKFSHQRASIITFHYTHKIYTSINAVLNDNRHQLTTIESSFVSSLFCL